MKTTGMHKFLLFFTPLLLLTGLFYSSIACSVPVFRYALERWQPDPYHVRIYYNEELPSEQDSIARLIPGVSRSSGYGVVGHYVRCDTLSAESRAALAVPDNLDVPQISLFRPRFKGKEPIWTGDISNQNSRTIASSPIRAEITRRILSGETAVWIFLMSGDRKKDKPAFKMVSQQLKKMSKELKANKVKAKDHRDLGNSSIPLRADFSMVTVSRTDPAEHMLVKMLLSEVEGADTLNMPMVFPVFGRGRALAALYGAKLNEYVIERVCRFLLGPCSCTVKAQNPGFDLLFCTNWSKGLERSAFKEEELPPLTGLGAAAKKGKKQAEKLAAQDKPVNSEAEPTPVSEPEKEAAEQAVSRKKAIMKRKTEELMSKIQLPTNPDTALPDVNALEYSDSVLSFLTDTSEDASEVTSSTRMLVIILALIAGAVLLGSALIISKGRRSR